MDFITRDQLIAAMHAWVLDKSKSLGRILRDHAALDDDTHALQRQLFLPAKPELLTSQKSQILCCSCIRRQA